MGSGHPAAARRLDFLLFTSFCLFIFLESLSFAASTTGLIRIEIETRAGKSVGFYSQSHALLIGVSDYTAGWQDLESVPKEIAELEATLVAQGFAVEKVLNPNSDRLFSAFDQFIDRYGFGLDNRLLFFFSGHGYTRKEKGYLVPADAPDPRDDEIGFARKALEMSQILAWSRKIESKHALFLFDSCFSGTIFKTKTLPGVPPHISDITSKPVRQFISAGSAGEEVPARSVFVPILIRGLQGGADIDKDMFVTGTELGMYLHQKVLLYKVNQTPQYGKIRDPKLDEGDFVFALKETVEEPPARGDMTFNIGGMIFKMIYIPSGQFVMGSPSTELGRQDDEGPQQQIKIAKDFWIGETEVTQGLWRAVMGNNPSRFSACGDHCPVEQISWNDVQEFLKKINTMVPGRFRLPTEAEWEYACRAGSESSFFFGNSDSRLGSFAWCYANSKRQTQRVGGKQPNAWKLYDMHGNVWEWCADLYEPYHTTFSSSQTPLKSAGIYVIRGGSWESTPSFIRSATRGAALSSGRADVIGFRIVGEF